MGTLVERSTWYLLTTSVLFKRLFGLAMFTLVKTNQWLNHFSDECFLCKRDSIRLELSPTYRSSRRNLLNCAPVWHKQQSSGLPCWRTLRRAARRSMRKRCVWSQVAFVADGLFGLLGLRRMTAVSERLTLHVLPVPCVTLLRGNRIPRMLDAP